MRQPNAQRLTRHNASKSGFSLIEILIVIALIAVIAGLAISNIGGIFGGQQEKAAKIFVTQSLKIPLTAYKIDIGSYPSTAEGLQALIQAPSNKSGSWRGSQELVQLGQPGHDRRGTAL